MTTWVVYESMWGNTRAVAEAVGRGIGSDVLVIDVDQTPAVMPAEVELLVVGGPTHAFSMSRESTRQDAVQKGAGPDHSTRGIREWLERQPRSEALAVATFDTRVAKVRRLPGSAAKAAAKSVRSHHLGRLLDSESFYVDDMQGPLLDHELERATEWGARLAAHRSDGPQDSR